MDVGLPPVLPQELNFDDLTTLAAELEENNDGYYFKRLATFLEIETKKLRDKFVSQDLPNRDAYEQVFKSSSVLGLVENTLELIWFTKFDCGDDEKKILKLEETMNEMEPKLEDLKLSWAKRPELLQRLKDFQQPLDAMTIDLKELLERIDDLDDLVLMKMPTNLDRIEMILGQCSGSDIATKLRIRLLRRHLQAIQENVDEFKALRGSMVKVKTIKNFNIGWCTWLIIEIEKSCNECPNLNYSTDDDKDKDGDGDGAPSQTQNTTQNVGS